MSVSLLVAISGCLLLGDDDVGQRQDVDQDGFDVGTDCDDSDADVGVATTWYLDADDDGFGDVDQGTTACDAPTERHLAAAGDCDDGDAAIHPDAVEICNGLAVDEDCDGLIDDADPDAAAETWYADADGDGWGDADEWIEACEPGSGYAMRELDCDDSNEDVNPEAVEICGDGVDQDCQASPDCRLDGDLLITSISDTVELILEETGATEGAFGGSLAHTGDFNGDGFPDLGIGARGVDATIVKRQSGAAYLFSSPPPDGAEAEQALVRLLGDELGGRAGAAVSGTGDLDGDGLPEFLVGAPDTGDLGAGLGAGRVHVVLSGDGALSGELGDTNRQILLTGEQQGDRAGQAVAAIGDHDGDGREDFAVSAPGGRIGSAAGVVYVVVMPLVEGNSYDLDDVSVRIEGSDDGLGVAGQGLGDALAGGLDMDEDGYADLFVGDPSADGDRGRAHLFLGETSPAGQATVTILGAAEGDLAGNQVQLTWGLYQEEPELLVTAPLANDTGDTSGAVYVAPLPPGAATIDLASDPVLEIAAGTQSLFGLVAASGGDLNGDGVDDLAVSALTSTGQDVVNLFYGPLLDALTADDAALKILSDNTSFGAALDLHTDLSGDGIDDLAVGAPGRDPDGAAWVIPGLGE